MAYKFQMGAAILSGALTPSLDDKFDLGTATAQWKDGHFDGTVNIDSLVADTADINGGTVDGAVIGGNSAAAGSFTTATVDALTATANLDIGAYEMRALTFESDQATGTAPFTVASTTVVANLNASTLGGATMAAPGAIGGTTPAAITATTLTATTFVMPTVTAGHILVADGTDYEEKPLSGDATLSSTGALTIVNDAVTTAKILDANVTFAKVENVTANSLLVRDANSEGVLSELALATTQIMIGDGAGFTAAALSGDVTMTNAGVVSIGATKVTDTMINDDVATALAGDGLGNTAAGAINLDLNELAAASVAVSTDSFAFIDSDGNGSKRESIADLATAMAGTGITATNGVFSTAAASAPNAVADANATLTESFNYASATITANRTWTLPASDAAGLSIGDVVSVKAATISAGFRIAIARAGSQTIDGSVGPIYLDSSYSAVQLKYVAADTWMIF